MEGMKHYGWVLLDRDDDSLFDVSSDKEEVDEMAREYNENGHFKPYRAVELFYKEDQS